MTRFNNVLMAAFMLLAVCLLAPREVQARPYVVGAGDKLEVKVWGEDSLDFTALVRPDGMITVPGVGDLRADGYTATELRQRLTSRISRLVRDPFVTVTLVEIVNSKAYIVGGGVAPTVYDLRQQTTLLQLLATLDSLQTADLGRAYVARNGKVRLKTDFEALFYDGDLSKDVILEHNDIIYIPAQKEPFVYVLGAVQKPRAVPHRESITVLDAILESGGFSKFADRNDTMVVRRKGKEKNVIHVKAGDIVDGDDLNENVVLEKGDYVIVDEGLF